MVCGVRGRHPESHRQFKVLSSRVRQNWVIHGITVRMPQEATIVMLLVERFPLFAGAAPPWRAVLPKGTIVMLLVERFPLFAGAAPTLRAAGRSTGHGSIRLICDVCAKFRRAGGRGTELSAHRLPGALASKGPHLTVSDRAVKRQDC